MRVLPPSSFSPHAAAPRAFDARAGSGAALGPRPDEPSSRRLVAGSAPAVAAGLGLSSACAAARVPRVHAGGRCTVFARGAAGTAGAAAGGGSCAPGAAGAAAR